MRKIFAFSHLKSHTSGKTKTCRKVKDKVDGQIKTVIFVKMTYKQGPLRRLLPFMLGFYGV